MSIGSMRERITIQGPNKQPNGQGGYRIDKANPAIIGEYWAAVTVLSNQENINYRGRQLEANIKIEARANSAINTGCQIKWSGKLLEITEITPGSKLGYIFIYAKEAVK